MEIRRANSDDHQALYRITLETGASGEDATALFCEPNLLGNIYSIPYLNFSPELSFVVENEGEVLGYCIGTSDTKKFEGQLQSDWWPKLRHQYPKPDERTRSRWSDDEQEFAHIFDPPATPDYIADNFPAHLHMDLLPEIRVGGVGSKLLSHWFTNAFANGVTAGHLGAATDNHRGVKFWQAKGFCILNEIANLPRTDTIWMGRKIDGQPH